MDAQECLLGVDFRTSGERCDDCGGDNHEDEGGADQKIMHWGVPLRDSPFELIHTTMMPEVTRLLNSTMITF